jgi:hypothetical protein
MSLDTHRTESRAAQRFSIAMVQLECVETLLPSLQLTIQQLDAWIEFLERGRRIDA